jgi:ABC-2 type transport system permease protein
MEEKFMFLHIFINRIKCVIRDREMMFWTFLFPVLLATLFGMALSNISSQENFKNINIAVVNNNEYQTNTVFKNALYSVSDESKSAGENKLFHVTLSTTEQAEDSLKHNKIAGYILFKNGVHVIVKESGINQTILKGFVDDYLQISSAVTKIVSQNPGRLKSINSGDTKYNVYLKEVSPTKASPNNILVYYYALIAMACLYGGFSGMKEVTAIQANLSTQGARINLAPVHKLKIFGVSLLAATAVQLVSIFILLAYLSFILKVDFGSQLGYILLACIAGCFTGVSFGAMIGAVIKKSDGVKTAVLIALSMTLTFLSGLMWGDIKYIIANSVPILSYVNPANLIADAFYSLYYYNTHARFFINIGLLFSFSIVFYLVVYFVMRRQKYASI